MTDSPLRLPAEWEPQSGVMLTWPHAGSDWADRLDVVHPVFARIGSAVAEHEFLLSVCQSLQHAALIERLLCEHGAHTDQLLFAIAGSNDTWARDHGPLTPLTGTGAELNDFRFNGWGGKFESALDDAIPARLHRKGSFGNAPMRTRELVLEGGAVETDGVGTLLATRKTIITGSRNPGMNQQAIEALLTEWLGFERYLWLDHGDISGDDTDGHVDTLARFADSETILYATAPPGDRDHQALADMARQLEGFTTRDGRPYRLLPLPFAGIHRDKNGRRLPATYANFLIINGAVLLPVYDVPQDEEAIAIVRDAFPDRQIVAIDCRQIIVQSGSLHCLTMQFPAQLALCDTLELFGT